MAAQQNTVVTVPGSSAGLRFVNLVLAIAVVSSAFLVIHSSHSCRQLYADLQTLEADQWYLQEDYSRLLLEQSAWASHYRVEKVATSKLKMHSPAVSDLRMVVP